MLERAAKDDGVLIVAPLRSDRSVAELSTRSLTGVDKRLGRPWRHRALVAEPR
jgi:hypothetical protein